MGKLRPVSGREMTRNETQHNLDPARRQDNRGPAPVQGHRRPPPAPREQCPPSTSCLAGRPHTSPTRQEKPGRGRTLGVRK